MRKLKGYNKLLFLIGILLLFYGCKKEQTISEQPSYGDESFPFFITQHRYSETQNLDQAVWNESFLCEEADWNDVKSWCRNHSAREFIERLHWQLGEDNGLFVKWNGNDFYQGTNRHYFMVRFDHNIPPNFLVHDEIENGYIVLGSWYNLYLKILGRCYFK